MLPTPPHFHPSSAARVFIQGAASLISEPGEWGLDSAAGTLFYFPVPEELPLLQRNGRLPLFATTTKVVLDVRGTGFDAAGLARNLAFRNMTIQGSDFGPSFNSDASYDSDTSPCKRAATRTDAYKALHNQGMVRIQNATNIDVSDAWLSDAGYSAVWLEGWAQNVSIVSNVVSRAGVMGVYLNGPLPGATHWGQWNSVRKRERC